MATDIGLIGMFQPLASRQPIRTSDCFARPAEYTGDRGFGLAGEHDALDSAMPVAPASGSGPELARRLGTSGAVVIGLGSMMGAGVFAAFAPAARAAGAGLLAGLAIAAVVAYCNATSSARLAARYPESGGTYVYGRERLGPFWGYLAGWGFVVGKTASCAAMALTGCRGPGSGRRQLGDPPGRDDPPPAIGHSREEYPEPREHAAGIQPPRSATGRLRQVPMASSPAEKWTIVRLSEYPVHTCPRPR